MPQMIPRKDLSVQRSWQQELADAFTDPNKLLQALNLEPQDFELDVQARQLFSMRVPRPFVAKMQVNTPNDPLLLQVLPQYSEFMQTAGFNEDPLGEAGKTALPGLLHKYQNRVLMIVRGSCAINCRYCFRRHFPYDEHKGGKQSWQAVIDYVAAHSELDEIILSGGDPLIINDQQFDWLLTQFEALPHLKRLRIHTRFPVVIPSRITSELCERLQHSRLQPVMVMHVNHPNEIDDEFQQVMQKLQQANVTLLNQSVLLKGINDDAKILKQLSERLFECGILPYYLHVLDHVQGAGHFWVSDAKAKQLTEELMRSTSGYLVPKLTRETAGQAYKTPLDLNLETHL